MGIRSTFARHFDREPVWTILMLFFLLGVGSCTAHNICVEWGACGGKIESQIKATVQEVEARGP